MKYKISRLTDPALFTIAAELHNSQNKTSDDLEYLMINTIEYSKYMSYSDLFHFMSNIYEFNNDYEHFLDIIKDIKNNNIDSYYDYIFEEYSIFKNLDYNDDNQISEILIRLIDDLYLTIDNDEESLICLIQNTIKSFEYLANTKKESSISTIYEPYECLTYLSLFQLKSINSLDMEVDEDSYGSGRINFLVSDYHKEIIQKITNIITSVDKSDFYTYLNYIMEFDEEIANSFEEYDDERNNLDFDDHCKFINLIEKYELDFIYTFFKVELDFEELDFLNTIFFEYSYLIIDIYKQIHKINLENSIP